jgi:DNA invertase Pin-like site-specific DNA recombinase
MRCAIYARVSTEDQDCELQLAELREYARRWGWDAELREYVEKLSGKAGVRRPQYDQLMEDARRKKIDCVVVWKLDRWGRSMLHLISTVQELTSLGIRFVCITQGIDTDKSNPMATLMMHMMGAFAEFERSLIVERTQAGYTAYRTAHAGGRVGKDKSRHSHSGKDLPVGHPKKIFARNQVVELRQAGKSMREIAQILDIGTGTVQRVLKASKQPA